MRNVKKIAVALVLFVVATGFVNAQSKVAHINVQQLLSEMPEMKAAQAELKKLQETYRADIENSYKELQNKYSPGAISSYLPERMIDACRLLCKLP